MPSNIDYQVHHTPLQVKSARFCLFTLDTVPEHVLEACTTGESVIAGKYHGIQKLSEHRFCMTTGRALFRMQKVDLNPW